MRRTGTRALMLGFVVLLTTACTITGLVPIGAGQIFITDFSNNRIVRINDMTGAGWTPFGTFGSATNQFYGPEGVYVSAAGQIFITDTLNNRIVRVNDMTGAGWA